MRSTHSADLVAAVPYLLGFHPRDSLVVIVMQADGPSRMRSGPLARLDLTELHGPARRIDEGLSLVLARLVDSETREVVLLAYHDGPHEDPGAHRPVVERVEQFTREWAPELSVQLLSVGHDSWGCVDCLGCCPPGGHPLEELVHSAVSTSFIAEGYSPADSRDGLAITPCTDADLRAQVARATEDARRVRGSESDREQRARMARYWDAALASGSRIEPTSDAHGMGLLLDSLQDVRVRDAVVAAAIAGTAVAEISTEADVGDAAERAEAGGPDRERVRATIAVVSDLAACAPPQAAAPPLATAAYPAWWLGEGARADVLAQQSLEQDPDYRLAALVLLALEGAMPPPWVAPRSPRWASIR